MNEIDCDAAAEAAGQEYAMDCLKEEIHRLRAENEALAKDAARWKFVKEKGIKMQPAVYACPTCGTGMEVDPTAKPAPTRPHEQKAVNLGQFRALSQGWLVGAYALGGDKGRKLALWGCAKELNDLLDLIDSQGAR